MFKKLSHSANYFRFLGVFSLIIFIGLLVYWFIDFFNGAIAVYRAAGNEVTIDGLFIFLSILKLLAIIVFGPALALLFFGHADLLEKTFPEDDSRKVPVNKKEKDNQPQKTETIYSAIPLNTEVVTLVKIQDVQNNILIPEGQVGVITVSTPKECKVKFQINGKTIISKVKREHIKSLNN